MSSATTESTHEPIPYATTPIHRPASAVWAAALIVACGLTLIVIGGCFLIGVMILVTGTYATGASSSILGMRFLIGVLYFFTFICVGAAGWLLVRGLTELFSVLRERRLP